MQRGVILLLVVYFVCVILNDEGNSVDAQAPPAHRNKQVGHSPLMGLDEALKEFLEKFSSGDPPSGKIATIGFQRPNKRAKRQSPINPLEDVSKMVGGIFGQVQNQAKEMKLPLLGTLLSGLQGPNRQLASNTPSEETSRPKRGVIRQIGKVVKGTLG